MEITLFYLHRIQLEDHPVGPEWMILDVVIMILPLLLLEKFSGPSHPRTLSQSNSSYQYGMLRTNSRFSRMKIFGVFQTISCQLSESDRGLVSSIHWIDDVL